jgi:hypothetical protein
VCFLGPDIFTGHRAVFFWKPSGARAKLLPPHIETFVKVTTIFGVGIFSQQCRVPLEVFTLVDVELQVRMTVCHRSGKLMHDGRSYLQFD